MDFIVKGAHYRGLWRSELLRLGCCETIGVSIRGWDLRSRSVVTGIRTGALAMRIERRWVMKVNEEVRMVDLVALEYPHRQLQARWLLWVKGIFWRGTHRWLSSNYAAGGQYPHTAGSTAAPCAGGENRSDPLLPTPVGLLCLKGKLQPMKTDGW